MKLKFTEELEHPEDWKLAIFWEVVNNGNICYFFRIVLSVGKKKM
jgi:hypothetical protein